MLSSPVPTFLFSLLALSSASHLRLSPRNSTIQCPLIFDGRVSHNATPSTFDDPGLSPFSTMYVKGENLTWSSIIHLPRNTTLSRFDTRQQRPFQVTISDASIFRTSQGRQLGFRRAGLLFKDDKNSEGADAADSGVVTFHWSVRQDAAMPMNLSHSYMNVWHERADYSGNQFSFTTGLLLVGDGGDGVDTREKRESWKVQDRRNGIVFETGVLWDEWQNFAVTLDHVERSVLSSSCVGWAPSFSSSFPLFFVWYLSIVVSGTLFLSTAYRCCYTVGQKVC